MVHLGPTEYRPRPGDIGLTQISGWGGKAIRLGQWLNGDGFADYEHAFVYVGQGRSLNSEAHMIVEAMPRGAHMTENWHDPSRTRWLVCPDLLRSAVVRSAGGFVGVPYSVADYVALAAHRLHVPAPHLRRYVRDSGHMICSQLADAAAAEGGWHLFRDNRWPGDVTPGDLTALWWKLGPEERA